MDSEPNLRTLSQNACVPCREKKVRCRSRGIGEICERCHRMRISCEKPPPRGPRRPKLHKTAQPVVTDEVADRIERLERNLQHVTSELAHQKQASQSPGIAESSHGRSYASPLLSRSTTRPETSRTLPEAARYYLSGFASDYRDVIDEGILTEDAARYFIEEFKIMARAFPYVPLPELNTLEHLRQESPTLLLAVLIVSSWPNRELQMVLDDIFLAKIGVFMAVGEYNVEILQALVVYLSWTHFHLKSTYRLIYFASAIVGNLGLNRRLQTGSKQRMALKFDFVKGVNKDTVSQSPEAKRAYIGLYVVSKFYSLILRRADAIKYTNLLEEYAISLASENAVALDATLIHWVRLIKYAEDVATTLGYSDLSQSAHVPEDKLQFVVKMLEARINKLYSDIPISLIADVALGFTHLTFKAFTYESIIHNLKPHQTLSVNQTAQLVDCLTGVRNIFELVSTLSDQSICNMCGYHWAHMHYLLYLALELTLGIDSPSWQPAATRQILCLETYLDAFLLRLDRSSLLIRGSVDDGNWFAVVAAAWRNMRTTYANGMASHGIIIGPAGVSSTGMNATALNDGGGSAQASIPGNVNAQLMNDAFADFDVDFMPGEWSFGMGAYGNY